MQWVSAGFIFRRGETFVHRLDPRVKLLLTVELFTISLFGNTPLQALIPLIGVLLVASTAKILRRIGRTLLFTLAFATFIFLINWLVGGTVVRSFTLAIRFIAIVGSTSLLFLTTSPDELEYVMRWFHLPQDIIFAFVTAVRFIPVLLMDAMQIMDAQKSRGLELDRGNFIARLKNLTPVLVPLVVGAVIRSSELAEAMESRAYGTAKRPTSLHELKMRDVDFLITFPSIFLFSLTLAYLIF